MSRELARMQRDQSALIQIADHAPNGPVALAFAAQSA